MQGRFLRNADLENVEDITWHAAKRRTSRQTGNRQTGDSNQLHSFREKG
jgi:hypothetical protein